jgi:F-type H+-transporting ATPase subunit epsilon
MKTIACEIMTPEKVVVKEETAFVVAPGREGVLGVLPGHARLVAMLRSGEVRIVKDRETLRFAVDGGFIRVGPAAVKIAAPAVQPL